MASRPLNNGFLLNTTLDFNGALPNLNFPADAQGIVRNELDDTAGLREYILVKNAGASATANGDCLVFVDNARTQVKPYTEAVAGGFSIGAALNRPAGVAVGVISPNNWGWIQTKGLHSAVKANGAVANGQVLTLDNTANKMVAPVALGTAAPYAAVGTAVAAAAAGTVAARLSV
jgi:hypothetical protein